MHKRVVFNFGKFKSRKCSISLSRDYARKGEKNKKALIFQGFSRLYLFYSPFLVAEMGFEPHELPHQSHSRRLSLSQDYSSADSLLCGVSRRKNDNQSFLLVRRLFTLRSQSDLGLITSKVIKSSHNRSQKEKIQSPKRVTEFLWLRRWDLNLMTFGL